MTSKSLRKCSGSLQLIISKTSSQARDTLAVLEDLRKYVARDFRQENKLTLHYYIIVARLGYAVRYCYQRNVNFMTFCTMLYTYLTLIQDEGPTVFSMSRTSVSPTGYVSLSY